MEWSKIFRFKSFILYLETILHAFIVFDNEKWFITEHLIFVNRKENKILINSYFYYTFKL